jgi:nitric oxide reductase NorQ protein
MTRELPVEEYLVEHEPFYLPVSDEVEVFRAAFACRLPVLLKGPTGCGKTRFVEYMAYQLGLTLQRPSGGDGSASHNGHPYGLPLITVSCHEDLTASDLVGRYLLQGRYGSMAPSPGPPATAPCAISMKSSKRAKTRQCCFMR